LKDLIESHPKKGNANVRGAIERDIVRLANTGPVFAVIDRDKVRQLWKASSRPADCMSGISQQFRHDAPGEYDLVFLIENVESLIKAACAALGERYPNSKPGPDLRDRLLAKAAWAPNQTSRSEIRKQCPSFSRLVDRISARVSALNRVTE
jgi:hypothetical protein